MTATEEVLADLAEFVAIPSDSRHASADTMREAAEWLAGRLAFVGGRVEETAGNPVVRADWTGAPGRPTVLVYGHYDVQPTGDLAEWTSPPYELTRTVVRGEDVVRGRGATDDKGPVLQVVHLVRRLLAERGTLPVNLRFLLEGEEEIGSPNLGDYVRERAADLACDLVVSADGAMWRPSEPSISIASKGLVSLDVVVTGAAGDLHSGRYGGTVANPVHALARVVASFHGPDGRVAVPGFYDGAPTRHRSGGRSWPRSTSTRRPTGPASASRRWPARPASTPSPGCGSGRRWRSTASPAAASTRSSRTPRPRTSPAGWWGSRTPTPWSPR